MSWLMGIAVLLSIAMLARRLETPLRHVAWLFSITVGVSGFFQAYGQASWQAGAWSVSASGVLCIATVLSERRSSWALPIALIGAGVAGGAAVILAGPTYGEQTYGLLDSGILAGAALCSTVGLTALIVALLHVTQAAEPRVTWTSLTLVYAAAAFSLLLAFSAPRTGILAFLPLSDAMGLPASVFVEVPTLGGVEGALFRLVDTQGARSLGIALVVLSAMTLGGALFVAWEPKARRLVQFGAGACATGVMVYLLWLVGERPTPEVTGVLTAAGVPPDTVRAESVGSISGPLVVAPRTVLGPLLVLWVLVVLGFSRWRISAPSPSRRSAILRSGGVWCVVSAFAWWWALAASMYANWSATGRYVHNGTLPLAALALLSYSCALGWRPSLEREGGPLLSWLALPLGVMTLALLTFVSGVLGDAPFDYLLGKP